MKNENIPIKEWAEGILFGALLYATLWFLLLILDGGYYA